MTEADGYITIIPPLEEGPNRFVEMTVGDLIWNIRELEKMFNKTPHLLYGERCYLERAVVELFCLVEDIRKKAAA